MPKRANRVPLPWQPSPSRERTGAVQPAGDHTYSWIADVELKRQPASIDVLRDSMTQELPGVRLTATWNLRRLCCP